MDLFSRMQILQYFVGVIFAFAEYVLFWVCTLIFGKEKLVAKLSQSVKTQSIQLTIISNRNY